MAAYAALVTLSKAIHQILPYEQHYSFLCDTQKMQSLLHKVIRFQGFLEGISGKSSDGIDELESRIRDVAHRLEDIVESILVHSLAMEYENEVNPRLSIQGADTQFTVGAESRDVSRKFRKVRKTVKNSSAEASISVTAEDLSKLKITLYGRESLSTLSPSATDTKVVLEDDVNQTTGHETVPSTSAESETSLDRKVVSGSLSVLSPGATDTKVVLEDDVNQTTGHETVPSTSAESETSLDRKVVSGSLSVLSPGATDTKVVLEDDVNQTTGHETVPSTSAESETSLDRKVVSGSLSVLSPGATDTKVVLEDDVNQTTDHTEYENEVNSRLLIQGANTHFTFGAEDRDVSRKSRKSVKEGSAEASISVTTEDLSKLKITLDGKESSSILASGATDTKVELEDDVNQTTGRMENQNEVNSRLSTQGAYTQFTFGAEGRDVSRKFRKVRKTVKDSSAEASISVTAEELFKLKITLYGKESSSILSLDATDTKVALEDDVNQTTGHETVPSTSAESEASLDGKVVSVSLSVLSPGATDTKVGLEDVVNQTTGHLEYENEVNSRLSIQGANTQFTFGAEGRAVSRKSRKPRKSVKDGSDEAHHSVKEEDILEMKKTLDGSLSILTPGDVNQTTGHEPTLPSTSAKSETETSLDNILGWCLDDQDLDDKAKYSHFPLTERVAAAFGNCIEEAGLLLEEATEMKKNLDNKLVISGTYDIATTSLSRGPPADSNDTVVGLKDGLNQILEQIRSDQRALEVIPITGMGGIGKTTLARAVYDHHRKQDHFDLVLWATVSQQYNFEEILRVLCPENTRSDAIVSVHQRLYGRRYLIILDDVWDEKVWDGVRNAFPNDNKRSRVILTTRLSNVATYVSSASTHDAHQMQLLNGEQSWDLLRETVYGHEIGCLSNFEYYMGRRISRNCKGLPLALVVIGGLLKLNNAEDHWEHVATSTTAEAAAGDDSMLKILSLSYRNLPPHLKACFLYFGMFPEDKEIPMKELVRLWCAEGFLKPKESKTMEEVAEECLEELVRRNLVFVSKKKKYNGKIKTSSIHDVLRELSLTQAGNERFLYRHDARREIDNDTFRSVIKDQARRVSFPEFNLKCSISFSSPLRTFRTDQLSGMIPQFKLLRVLGTLEFSSAALRNSVRLNNLRYLHLTRDHFDAEEPLMVPKSISKLRNLETLFVSYKEPYYSSDYKYDLILPVEIWEMPRLWHLGSEHVNMKLPPFPNEDSSISIESWSLQTLSGVVNFDDFSPRVIQKLQQNLKKLHVKYKPISGDEDKEFVLENLHHLQHLTILSEYSIAPRVRNIGFPINLKKLRLDETYLPWEKLTSIGDLIHLQVLKLSWNAFDGKVWEPIEGGFPQLKYLKMQGLYLEEWRAESTHFPSLEKLLIMYCEKLKEVPGEIGDIDALEKLIVKRDYSSYADESVGASFEESVRRIEEEQQRVGNHSLQIIFLSRDQELHDVDR